MRVVLPNNPVLFLDIDGVLNCGFDPVKGGVTGFNYCNSYSIEALNEIIRQTNPNIVISSAWRTQHSVPTLQKILENWGVRNANIIGATPEMSYSVHQNWQPNNPMELKLTGVVAAPRAEEIGSWLDQFPTNTFCVLDDKNIFSNDYWTISIPEIARRWVQTSYRIGLTPQAIPMVVQRLTSAIL